MERRAAQRAARRPLLPPRADGLDDAPPAAAGVAARPQLAVGRARQAHRARDRITAVRATSTSAALAFAGPITPDLRFYTYETHERVLTFPSMRIWRES